MANSRSARNSFGGPSFSASASDDADQPQNDWARDTFGTPMQPQAMGADNANPASSASGAEGNQGGMDSANQYSMAEGGAVPDDDEDDSGALDSNAGVEDKTTTDLSSALQVVQQALMYSRQQHGLPGGGGSSDNSEPSAQQDQGGIPDEGDGGDSGGGEAYAEGGAVGEDIQASNDATYDGPQYGRPEVVDDPEAVRPPISSDNTDRNVPMEQAPPQQAAAVGSSEPGANVPMEQAPPQQAAARGDESGALPVATRPNDESGAAPVAGDSPQARSGGIPDEYMPHNMLRNGVQSIIGYLQGKGAMPNDQAVALEKSVEPQAKNDPAAVPVLAVAAARTPDEQAAYLQRNRQVYGVAMAHGQAALNGVEGRPADLGVAIADATKAFSHVPDGDNVHFAKHGDGVVAQISGAGGTKTQSYALSLQQFGALLDPGKAGMFDRMMAPGGLRKVLSSFAPSEQDQIQGGLKGFQGTGTIGAPPAPRGGIPDEDADRPGAQAAAADSDRNVTMGHDVTRLSASPQYKQQNPDWGKSPERIFTPEERKEINPKSKTEQAQEDKLDLVRARNEGKATIDDKLKLEDRKGENRIKAEDAKGKYKTQHEDRLDARSSSNRDSREKIAANKLIDSAKAREATNGRNAASNSERLIAAKTLAGQKLTPQEQAVSDHIVQGATQQQQAPQAPQQQAPQAPQLTKAQIGEMLRKRGLLQ